MEKTEGACYRCDYRSCAAHGADGASVSLQWHLHALADVAALTERHDGLEKGREAESENARPAFEAEAELCHARQVAVRRPGTVHGVDIQVVRVVGHEETAKVRS